MKLNEWLEIASDIADRWPHASLPEETVARWGDDLADLSADAVSAVVEAMYREGREFPPNGGQIRKRLAEMVVDVPEWGWAIREMRAAASKPIEVLNPERASDEDPFGHDHPRQERLEESGPLVVAFVEHCGWEQILAGLEGGNGEARLREKWFDFTKRAEQQVALAGIRAPAELKTLARIAEGEAHGELRPAGTSIESVRRQLEAARDVEPIPLEAEVVED